VRRHEVAGRLVKTFLLFFALMFLTYGLACINFRMIARGSYFGTAWSDAAIALLGFTLIRYVASTDALIAQVGYVSGGVCGSMLGLYLTRVRTN
jgi:hypothetical protein